MYSQHNLSITTSFESADGHRMNQIYHEIIQLNLEKVLPIDFFEKQETEELTKTHQQQILEQVIPLISCSETRSFPGSLSFFLIAQYRPNSFKFFFEMISRWLCPGKRLNVVLVHTSDFRLSDLSSQLLTMCEVMISVASEAEFEEIQRNFPIIAAEITLGCQSEFYAQRILEIKGLAIDDKTALVQGFIAFLVKRFPEVYGNDIFTEMQHILVTCRDDFKAVRQPRHLSRLISIQYLFRKALREAIQKNAQRRNLNLKIFRSQIQSPTGTKNVLSLLVGVNFLRDQETLGEEHLLKAVKHFLPLVELVPHSYFTHKSENICIAYLEVEKSDGASFGLTEVSRLRRELPANVINRIEHKLHPVFMPRNEEEIMRNMLSLTNQIKYLRDIPQVIISFDEQTHSHLFFTVILARVLKSNSQRISELFKTNKGEVDYLHDRTKIMGHLRKKYPKEATVFRLKICKQNFLRGDHTIDLYKARQKVAGELSRVIGEVRDYNGGMISKEQELLTQIKRQLVGIQEYDEWLLDNFFYSLAPLAIRALLDPKAFKTLFVMLLEGISQYKQEGYYFKFYAEPFNNFAIVIVEDAQIRDAINHAVQDLQIPATELAYAHTKANGNVCLGFICCARNLQHKEKMYQTIVDHLHARYENTL